MTKNKRRARKTQHPGPGTQSRTWHHAYNGVPTVCASRTDEGGNPRTALVRRRPSPTTRPHPPGGLRARASRFTAHVCTLVSEEHGTAPGSAWPRRHLVARSPWRPVGGDPCENWAKSALMNDVLPGPRALSGQWRSGARFPRRNNGQHTEGREAPSTIRCIETYRETLPRAP